MYERVPKKYGTILTFALSAVWHGFYPGYYLTFATGALMVTSARMVSIHHYPAWWLDFFLIKISSFRPDECSATDSNKRE